MPATAPRIRTRPVPDAPGLAHLPPLLQRLYAARGVTDARQLDYGLAQLPDYAVLRDIDNACDLLATALTEQQFILVVGDFDADGATSAALVCDALIAMGAVAVDCFVPNRMTHGYGLSPAVVEAIGEQGRTPGLLITVDNGITSHAGVEAAQAAGWRVLVTDHHLPGTTLPPAEAIINPNQPGCGAFGGNLAGVGVAFYLMAALRGRLRRQGQGALPHLGDYLDLVAVGTVADMVPLDHLNRLLVAQGLRRIRNGRTRPGIAALIEAAERDPARLVATDIGFGLAPCLNAAGRLDDMREGIACLRASDHASAARFAARLSMLNNQRRDMQQDMQAEAERALARHRTPVSLPAGLTVHDDGWHEGIVGLLAGKLCEHYKRPVVAFAPSGNGDLLKGSARSTDGIHMRDVLAAMAAENPELIERFGGHARAAGLQLTSTRLDEFSNTFARIVAEHTTADGTDDTIITDGTLAARQLDLQTAHCLRDAGPWGTDFEAPLFHGDFEVLSHRLLKGRHLKMAVQPTNGRQAIDAIAFNRTDAVAAGDHIRLVYRLEVNRYRGLDSANLIVEDILTAEQAG